MNAVGLTQEVVTKQAQKISNRVTYGTRYLASMDDVGDIVTLSTKKVEKQSFFARIKKSLGVGKKSVEGVTKNRSASSLYTDLYSTVRHKEKTIEELIDTYKRLKGELSDVKAKYDFAVHEYESGALDRSIKELQEKIKKVETEIQAQKPRKAVYPTGMEKDPILIEGKNYKPAETMQQLNLRKDKMYKEQVEPLKKELSELTERKRSFVDRIISLREEEDKIVTSMKDLRKRTSVAIQEYRAFRETLPKELHFSAMKSDNDIERFWGYNQADLTFVK